VELGQQVVAGGRRRAVAVAMTMTVTMSMGVTMTVSTRLVRARIDSHKSARRRLCGLRRCLGYMRGASVHKGYVGRTQRANRWDGARGGSAVENGLLTALQSMVELSCARGHCTI
jgi:hypothetical protein